MQITPKAGPAIPFIDKSGPAGNAAKENRARAIAAFNGGGQAPQAPQGQNTVQEGTSVRDASNVSPEEFSSLRAQVKPTEEPLSEQSYTSDTEEVTSPTKVEEPLSPHYAILARKEKALRAETQKLNAARQAFKAEQEALKLSGTQTPKASTFDESKYIPKDRMTQDPVSVLEELGFSREDMANRLLNQDQISPAQASYMAKLEAKIAKLEAAQDESKKTFETSQTDSYNQAITAMTYEAEELVASDPEFATIKETGQAEEIVNLIKDVHEKGLPGKYRPGTLLSVEQAARLVEDELVNQWIEQHEKLSRLEKIQKRLKPATPVAKPSQTTQGTQSQSSTANQNTTRTLTNNMTSGGKPLSARERAIAVFNGNKT